MTDAATDTRFEASCEADDLALIDVMAAAFGRHASRIHAKAEETAKTNAGAASLMSRTAAMFEDCARDIAALRDPAQRR